MPYSHSSSRRGGSRPASSFNGRRPMHKRGRTSSNKPKHGAYIHPSRFVHKALAPKEQTPYEATHSFSDFPFATPLQATISFKGFVTPSAIQDQAIPVQLEGHDVIGLANTGTGKTAAFLLPIIHSLLEKRQLQSVLIMAPTRELAQQIEAQFRDFSYNMKLYATLVVGGTNIDKQIRQLRRRPHVIIGTPGRLKDLFKRGELPLSTISTLVLDEADRMLDMGFINDIKEIVSHVPEDRQTLFFSATMTDDIRALTNQFLRDPHTISVVQGETSDHVDQDIVIVKDKNDKADRLIELLLQEDFKKVLVFGETKFGVQRLSDTLEKQGVSSAAIHGNKSQSQRQRALSAFKDDKVRVLVATDVAARGIDVPSVTHVINFDQPATYEDYVHRIGRTGRGGASGKALTFVIQ